MKLFSTLTLALLLVACPGVVFATQHTVGSGADFATIALALADEAVGRGDTLALLDGTHTAEDEHPYQSMAILSQSGDKNACLISNGNIRRHAFSLQDTADVSFYNLEFRGLNGPFSFYDGCMIYADGTNASFYVEGCEFNYVRNDSTGSCGPAVHVTEAARVEFVDCVFDSCRTPTDMGTCGAVVIAETKVARVRNCVFSYNAAPSVVFGRGGALGIINSTTAADSAAIVSGCLFVGNNAGFDAALRIYQEDADVEVRHCTFADNTAGFATSGNISTYGQVNSTLTVSHCIITGGNAYAVNGNGTITTAEHMNTWGTAEDHVFAGVHIDTLHLPPEYNTTIAATGGYGAGADGVWRCRDDSYMGWWQYVPRKPKRIAWMLEQTRRGRR